MSVTPLVFVPLGFGNILLANNIVYVSSLKAKPTKRMYATARKSGRYIDWTAGRGASSIIMLNDGTLIGCAFNTSTVFSRLVKASQQVQGIGNIDDNEGSEDDGVEHIVLTDKEEEDSDEDEDA